MAKSAKRSKRSKRSKCSKRSKRRSHRGGVAPLNDNSMSWASKMSMGQGGDYLKYHVGQHGGAALVGADLSHDSMLPSHLRASAHLAGIDRAIAEVQHYKDQAGGRRRSKRSKRRGSKRSGSKRSGSKRSGSKRSGHKRSKRSGHKRSHRRTRRRTRRGGALGYAEVGSKSMLLSPSEYQQAGLADWKTVEVEAAKARAAL